MSWLNYHHLYYFYTIADEGSITKATKKLKLAQSTLSAQLSQFEDACGCKLFERKNRALHLTDNGKTLFEYADEIFSRGREIQDFLRDQKRKKTLKIQIGVVDTIPRAVSERLVDYTIAQGRGVITVVEGRLTTLLAKLKQHKLDFVLSTRRLGETKSKDLVYRLAKEVPIFVVGSPEWKKLRHGFPGSIRKQPFVFPGAASNLRAELNEYFDSHSIKPKKVVEAQNIELQRRVVLGGRAIAALPVSAIDQDLQNRTLVQISKEPIAHEKLWVVTANRKLENPLARSVMDEFLKEK